MEDFIREYGYAALSIGTFFEGETAIIFASFLIHNGLFDFFPTILFAFLGSFVSDWLYFFIGKLNGKIFIERRPKLKAKVEPVTNFFERRKYQILFSYRFLYGFRVIIPIVIGMSAIKTRQYLFYSIVSGLIWACVVTTLGFFVGKIFSISLEEINDNLIWILLSFGCFGMLLGYTIQRIVNQKNN